MNNLKQHFLEQSQWNANKAVELKKQKAKLEAELTLVQRHNDLLNLMTEATYPAIDWEDSAVGNGIMPADQKREGKNVFDRYDIEHLLFNGMEFEAALALKKSHLRGMSTPDDEELAPEFRAFALDLRKRMNKALNAYTKAREAYYNFK